MKKIYLVLISVVMATMANAQVTVTNPGNTTPGLAATYTTLALAIADLNVQTAISGPVIITLNAGNPQTCPAGGYSITAILAGASAANTVTLEGSANTITAPVPAGAVGALTDAIFKFIGSDFMTLQNFVMNENAANLVTASGTNDMVEWGVALLYASTTDGAQNITIQNNTIALNRTYQNTFGIYSNSTHSATTISTSVSATTTAGGNSGLKVYSNNINNVNNGIVVVGPLAAADMNNGVDIGGSPATANTLTNYGTTATFSGYANVSGTVNGILVRNSTSINVSYNSITSSVGGVTSGTLNGIQFPAFTVTPTGTFTQAINNNSITLRSGNATGIMNGINIAGVAADLTSTININNNDFNNFGHTVAASGAINFIVSASGAQALVTNVNLNTFTNMTVNTTGSVFFINTSGAMPLGSSENVLNNSIVTQFTKTGAGGTIAGYVNSALGVTGSTMTHNLNNFSNITGTGATAFVLWSNTGGAIASGTTKNITNNTFSNITGGLSGITAISCNGGGSGTTVSNNIISNMTISVPATAVAFAGIVIGTVNGGATQTYSNNTISGLVATGAVGAQIIGIQGGSSSVTNMNINNNTISGCTNTNVAGNTFAGMSITPTGATTNIFKNKIYDFTSAAVLSGISVTATAAANTINISNNYLGRLYCPTSGFFQSVRGINCAGIVAATFNVYYNTVYLDGTTPTQTYCLYIGSTVAGVPNVNPINNILVNNVSSSNGATLPQTCYFRLGTTTPANLLATANNNLLYCGTPAADHLIYFDGAVNLITNPMPTLAAYQALVATRESASKTEMPPFLNTTNGALANYLHISNLIATQVESGGTPVFGFIDDYDNDPRNIATPDIGADEFAGIPASNMVYVSSTTTQNTSNVGKGTTTQQVIGIQIVTSGSLSPLTATSFTLNTNGTTAPGTDISNAKLWYTGLSSTFVATTQFGSTVAAPSGSFVISGGPLALSAGTNYFWLTYDVPCTAVLGNVIDGECNDFTIGTTQSPIPQAPPGSRTITVGLSSDVTIGSGGTYPTLTGSGGLFEAINGLGLGASINATIISTPITENGAVALNTITYGCAGPYTLTIRPNAGVAAVLTGSNSPGAIIKLNGADNVTIDGLNTGGSSLSVTNTSTGANTAVIWLGSASASDGASNNTIRNCALTGATNTTTPVALIAGSGSVYGNPAEAANSNNTITGNTMKTAQNAAYINGVAIGLDQNWVVSNNTFGSTVAAEKHTFRGMLIANAQNFTISGNTINGVVSTATSTATMSGIHIFGTINGGIISKNKISDIKQTNTAGWGSNGIFLAATSTASGLNINNNFIYDVASFGFADVTQADNGYGIMINTGGGYNIYHNTVVLTTNQTAVTGITAAINVAVGVVTAASIDLRDNIIVNNQTVGVRYGVYCAAPNTVFSNMDYNDYSVAAGGNLGFVGGSARANLAAMQAGFGGNLNSLNIAPTFVNPLSDFHLAPSNCTLDGTGTPIGSVTVDYDNETRNITTPDMGADEFIGLSGTLAATPGGGQVCNNALVDPAGTTYKDPVCNAIARIVPNGGSPATGMINTCVTIDATVQTYGGEAYVQRHFDITPAVNQSTATARVTLYVYQSEFDTYNLSNGAEGDLMTNPGDAVGKSYLRITKYSGDGTAPGNYVPGVPTVIDPVDADIVWDAVNNWWAISFDVTGFSGFYIHSGFALNPLPVSILNFSGYKDGSRNQLRWTTSSEQNNSGFEMQRSTDGINYTALGFVNTQALSGNSTVQLNYAFTDNNVIGSKQYYRLRQVNFDGNSKLSNIVLIKGDKPLTLVIDGLFPNPASSQVNVLIGAPNKDKVTLIVTDIAGRTVVQKIVNVETGSNTIPVDITTLANGTYMVKLVCSSNCESAVGKFVKQ